MNMRTSLLALGGLTVLLLILNLIFGRGFFRAVLYGLVLIGLGLVLVSLFAGLGVMTVGASTQDKATQAKWTNYLMRSRVFAQGMTIVCGTILIATRADGVAEAVDA